MVDIVDAGEIGLDIASEQPKSIDDIMSLLGDDDEAVEPDAEEAANGGDPDQLAADEDGGENDELTDEIEPDQDDRESVIAPPDGWTDEDRKLFSKIPRDLQAVIANRDREQKSVFNRQINEAVQAKLAAEQTGQRLAETLRNYTDTLVHIDPVLAEAQKMTPADWEKLSQEDPVTYVQKNAALQAKISGVQAAMNERARLEQERWAMDVQRGRQVLLEKIPEWRDPDTFDRERREVAQVARELGYSDQELSSLADPRPVLLSREVIRLRGELRKYQGLDQKKAPPPTPKTQRPGANSGKGVSSVSAMNQQLASARSTSQRAEIIAKYL